MDSVERTIEESIYHERHNIIGQCHRRMQLGAVNYGDKDICLSEVNFLARDIPKDFEEETLDRINYAKMLIVGIRYRRMKSKPRDFKGYFDSEMQNIDTEIMQYLPPEGDVSSDFESWLIFITDRDIRELISFRIMKELEARCESEST